MTPRVELIYDTDCPNVERARAALLQAFQRAGIPPSWTEWDREDPESPPYARLCGSPTILIDGADVTGLGECTGSPMCRLYVHSEGSAGTPPVELITRALMKGRSSPRKEE